MSAFGPEQHLAFSLNSTARGGLEAFSSLIVPLLLLPADSPREIRYPARVRQSYR